VIPLQPPATGVPPLTFLTDPHDPNVLQRLFVFRNGESLQMGYGQVPVAAYSDGRNLVAIMGRGGTNSVDPDGARSSLEHDPPTLQPARTLLHEAVAAERDRLGSVIRRRLLPGGVLDAHGAESPLQRDREVAPQPCPVRVAGPDTELEVG
jgi:hypothetical protein